MGGSGIGGKLVGKWIENEINVPVLLHMIIRYQHSCQNIRWLLVHLILEILKKL